MKKSNLAFLQFLLVCLCILPACERSQTSGQLTPTRLPGVFLREIGYGNKDLSLLNTLLLDPEAGVEAEILQTTHDGAFRGRDDSTIAGRVVRFQPSTGRTTYLDLRGSTGAWAGALMGNENYLGSHQTGSLYHLALDSDSLRPLPIPRPNDERFEFIWSLDFGSDGMVYAGSYPEGHLLRYRPDSDEFENLGPMVKSDSKEKYIRHVNGKFPGKIYCGTGTPARLVEFDLATGEKTQMLPAAYQQQSFVYYTDRFKDLLYAVVTPEHKLLFFDPETRKLLREVSPPDGEHGFWLSSYRNMIPVGDALYFGTSPNDHLYRYDYQQDRSVRVAPGAGRPFGLAQERYLFCRDYFGTFNVYDLQEQSIILSRKTKFEGSGMHIYSLAKGENNGLIGGSYINQGYFEYDASTGRINRFGAAVSFGGQIDNLIHFRGKNFLAHYTKARISVYDPELPWQPGNTQESNPRIVAKVGHDQDRFPAAYLGEDNKIYFGTTPQYGALGGALVIFDPESYEIEVFRNLVPDQSIYSLLGNGDGLLFGTTSVRGGFGAIPKAQSARLFIWDMPNRAKIKERVIVEGSYEMWDMTWAPGGRLLGAADSILFVYDHHTDQVLATKTIGPKKITALEMSRDGWCYGNTEEILFRITPDLETMEIIDDQSGYWNGLIETDDGRLYVTRGSLLYEIVRE